MHATCKHGTCANTSGKRFDANITGGGEQMRTLMSLRWWEEKEQPGSRRREDLNNHSVSAVSRKASQDTTGVLFHYRRAWDGTGRRLVCSSLNSELVSRLSRNLWKRFNTLLVLRVLRDEKEVGISPAGITSQSRTFHTLYTLKAASRAFVPWLRVVLLTAAAMCWSEQENKAPTALNGTQLQSHRVFFTRGLCNGTCAAVIHFPAFSLEIKSQAKWKKMI